MQLSPLYLEKIREAELVGEQRAEQRAEQRGVLKGQQELVLRLLNRKVGTISTELEEQINSLPLAPLEELGEALLDFTQMCDLIGWLDNHQS